MKSKKPRKNRNAQEPKNSKEEIIKLKREVTRLRRENKRLSQLIALQKNTSPGDQTSENLAFLGATHRLMNRGSYISYLGGFIRSSSTYRVGNRLIKYSGHFRFFSTLLRTSARVVAFIEASAVLLLMFSAAVVLIPVLFIITLLTVLLAMLENRKMLDEISAAAVGHKVYVFFPASKKQLRPDSFYSGNLSSLGEDPDITVIAVSPSILADGSAAFLSARKKGRRYYLVRRHFFFKLRALLKQSSVSAVYVF